MKKILLVINLLLFCFVSFAQVYQEMPQYGYRANRMIFDSTLSIPTTCGVPTLKSNITKKAAIAFDSCNNKLYQYNPKTLTWSEIAGGSTDTTSLSNRINLKLNISDTASMLSPYLRKVDTASLSNRINLKLNISDTANKWVNSINRISGKDSIIYFIGSTRYAIKDSVGTNPAPVGYYGAFQDTTTQTAASINTAYSVKLNRTDLSNGVSVVNDGSGNPTRITLANTGIYNIQFSLQLEKTGGSGNMIADIWIRKNGVDIPSTTGKVVLTGSANASPIIAAWNYVLDLAAGDYIQLMWSTSNTNVEIVAAPATSPHPSIPSVILTVTQQSGIMAGTGITAINSLTGAAQTIVTGTSGTDFNISSATSTHTFNLPTASATNRGALSASDWSTFNGKLNTSDSTIYYTKFRSDTSRTAIYNSINTKLNTSDSTIYYTKFRSDTSRTNIYNQLAQELNIADSTIYYTKFRSDTSRSNIYSSLSNKGYAINLGAASTNIAASSTYYFGIPVLTVQTTAAIRRVYIPQSGTIKGGQIYMRTTSATSTETWTISIRLNNTTNTTFASTANNSLDKVFGTTGLNISVVAGDYIEITTTTPAFTTAPGSTFIYGSIFIQ